MSYFNDFAAGYKMTSDARERNRDRQDKLDQEKLRREFELGRDVERYKQEDFARRAGYDNQTNQRVGAADAAREAAERGYEFTSGEGEKGRIFTGGEGEKGRIFTAKEAALGRTSQDDIVNRQLNQAMEQFKATNERLTAADVTRQGLLAQTQWMKDNPNSLANQKLSQEVTKLTNENANAGPLPGEKAPAVGLPIYTPAEARAAKPGTRYRTQDGRQMIR